MRRLDRLFEIIQILRSENRVVTAAELAERLEVSCRTVYRDVQALQAQRVPIDGEAGVGYLMGKGYDLPPINFSNSEVEAIVVGLNMLARTGDLELEKAAHSVASKIETVRGKMDTLMSSKWGSRLPAGVDMSQLRSSIRKEQKLLLTYRDGDLNITKRTVQPIALVYYIEVIVLVAWCQLRGDFRHFRVDRIQQCHLKQQLFSGKGDRLRKRWKVQAS